MKQNIECTWNELMSFESKVNNHLITLDADEKVGGKDLGPRPKPLLLLALAGCTGMDVISILKKMRVQPESFTVNVEGEQTDSHPKYYHKIHIIYTFTGSDLPPDKIEKAVTLSQENYCGVSAMLRKAATLTHEIVIK